MRINPINNNQTNFGAVYKVKATQDAITHFDANIAKVFKNKEGKISAIVQLPGPRYSDMHLQSFKKTAEKLKNLFVLTDNDAETFNALNFDTIVPVTKIDNYIYENTKFLPSFRVKYYKEFILKDKQIEELKDISELEKKLGYK